jgi:hypothetical protein
MEDETATANVDVTPDLYDKDRLTVARIKLNGHSRIRMAWNYGPGIVFAIFGAIAAHAGPPLHLQPTGGMSGSASWLYGIWIAHQVD